MGTCGKSIREGIRKNYFVAFFIGGALMVGGLGLVGRVESLIDIFVPGVT